MGNHRAERRSPLRAPSARPQAVEPQAPASTSRPTGAGKRRATPPPRTPLAASLPSFSLPRSLPIPPVPVVAGVAALAVAVGGAVTAQPALDGDGGTGYAVASAMTGSSAVGAATSLAERRSALSRDSSRDAQEDAADERLLEIAEAQARQRNAALAQFAELAEAQAQKIAANQWVLPLDSYRITATFGMSSGLWSSTHTGLDFAAPSGTPIKAVANGVITEAGYDGSYGNKTVLTLEDGTEIWFCHQTAFAKGVGETVRAGEVIGYVGSTGNSTGSHLHLEVRPGAGDPVDPYQALVVNGVTP